MDRFRPAAVVSRIAAKSAYQSANVSTDWSDGGPYDSSALATADRQSAPNVASFMALLGCRSQHTDVPFPSFFWHNTDGAVAVS